MSLFSNGYLAYVVQVDNMVSGQTEKYILTGDLFKAENISGIVNNSSLWHDASLGVILLEDKIFTKGRKQLTVSGLPEYRSLSYSEINRLKDALGHDSLKNVNTFYQK